MSASISSFAATINKRGIARNNRFLVLIPPLRAVNMLSNPLMNAIIGQIAPNFGGNSALGIALICSATELPGRSFMTADKREYPQPIENVPYAETPGEMTMKFILGRDMFEYFFFQQWENDIVHRSTNLLNYYDEYTTSIIVSQLDENDNVIASVELENSWPVAVSPVQMAFSNQNQYAELSVTFKYKRWVPIMTPYSLAETVLTILNDALGGASSLLSSGMSAIGGAVKSGLSSLSGLL